MRCFAAGAENGADIRASTKATAAASAMTFHSSWRDDAACRDADPDLFFPVSTTGPALRQLDEAKRICRACPAQFHCLAWALDNGVTDGVWGGTTAEERRAIRRLSSRVRISRE
jgi:WhiB family transcriptional regulator, redox-sensing transcriptional regulator